MKPFFSSAETGLPEAEVDFSALEKADRHLRSALRKSPGHGDAWNALSMKYVFDCQRYPMKSAEYGKYIRATSDRALACSESVPAYYPMRATAEMMVGDFGAVEKTLKRAVEMAPFNAPYLLECAEIYRAFPQGTAAASELLDRVSALLPKSRYVESMRALISFGEGFSDEADGNDESEEYVIPEF